VEVARPPPVPSSGFLPLSTVLAVARGTHEPLRVRRSPWRPDASRVCFTPLAPLESPFRAFPSRGAVPALAGLLLPCGWCMTAQRRGVVRGIREPFRRSRRPLATARPKAGWTPKSGRRFPGSARRRLTTASRLERHRAHRTRRPRHVRFAALLPSRVRSRSRPRPNQVTIARPVLSWASSPLKLAPCIPRGSVSASTNAIGTNPCRACLRKLTPGHA
jgi:hypothetical protein